MATHAAIAAVCEAVIQLLRTSYQAAAFQQLELEFKVYGAQDFTTPMQSGVSLFLHRVVPNTVLRNPPGRLTGGKAQKPALPVDLHFLITVWAKEASLQNMLAGWLMRCLEDTPILPPTVLNAVWAGVFRPDETVEVVLSDMSTQDLMQTWERLQGQQYRLSIPYVARGVNIESGGSST